MDGSIVIGEREIWGNRHPFGLSRDDRRHHLYVLGQTGTGKSTLLCSLLAQDIAGGEGVAIIDPHGDLVRNVMDAIPKRRIDDVVIIAPGDLAHPVGWNPFFRVPEDERPLMASNLTSALRHVWRDSWGARLEFILYNSIAAILDAPDHLRPTILSIPRLLADDRYRAAIVRSIRDPQVRFFWEREFANWSERFLSEALSPVQNKIGAIVSAPSLRNILGQWRPSIDLAKVMAERKILLVNLSKGEIGEDKTNLLGSLLVAAFQSAAMKRAALPESERSDFHCYIDEFHNFGTDAFASILSEARKFRLTLTLAHQYLSQVPDETLDAVMGNVGSLVCFRVGASDADRMAREVGDYNPTTLRDLGRGEVCARLLQGGVSLQAFLARTYPLRHSRSSCAAKTINQSKQRYANNRTKVESNISNWLMPLRNLSS